jgi:hypothetical protein
MFIENALTQGLKPGLVVRMRRKAGLPGKNLLIMLFGRLPDDG